MNNYHYNITNGDITYTVVQVGEYMYNIYKEDGSVLKRIDPLNQEKETEYFSQNAINKLMTAMNMWIVE